MDRAQAIERRKEVLSELAREEKMLFFGSLYPGSHEPTEEGFQAAQENARRKKELRAELAELNKLLGLPSSWQEQLVDRPDIITLRNQVLSEFLVAETTWKALPENLQWSGYFSLKNNLGKEIDKKRHTYLSLKERLEHCNEAIGLSRDSRENVVI